MGPPRPARAKALAPAAPKVFTEFDGGTGENQAVSTTMVFGKLLRNLMRDASYGKRVVPIIPDEARTFGLEVLFREIGIYASAGQKYEPVDSKLVLSYTEKADGQLLDAPHQRGEHRSLPAGQSECLANSARTLLARSGPQEVSTSPFHLVAMASTSWALSACQPTTATSSRPVSSTRKRW